MLTNKFHTHGKFGKNRAIHDIRLFCCNFDQWKSTVEQIDHSRIKIKSKL